MKTVIVDTHAHLDMREFAGDLDEVLARAEEAGVGRVLTVGIDLASSRAAVDLADRFPSVWATVGVHPNDAASWTDEVRHGLEEMLGHPKVAAVGETGLDFFRNRSPRDLQERAFREQIELARDARLPLVIHAREAHGEVLELLRTNGPALKGVMHCFAGGLDEARAFVDLGLKLSLGGPLTYPNAERTRQVFSSLPLEHFMLETDCPFLPPQGRRGQRNEPAFLESVLELMGRLKALGEADVARVTTATARDLFGLGLEQAGGVVAYRIRRSLYLNITNRCSNACTFCGKRQSYRVKGHNLKLDGEPTTEEVLAAVSAQGDFDEVVFCGYGEPLLRLETVKAVAREMKRAGFPVRVNTNGLASLTHGRSVPRELKGLVDRYSVSLNAQDEAAYQLLCRPGPGAASFQAVLDFISEAVGSGAAVTATAVAVPGVDLGAVELLARSLGADFRRRDFNEVG